jgi:hypothetical protein
MPRLTKAVASRPWRGTGRNAVAAAQIPFRYFVTLHLGVPTTEQQQASDNTRGGAPQRRE